MSKVLMGLVGALALALLSVWFVWGERDDALEGKAKAESAQATAEQRVKDLAALSEAKDSVIDQISKDRDEERKSAQELQLLTQAIQATASERELMIKEIISENEELRSWASERLPDGIAGLRKRPTLTGADAYRVWGAGSNAVHPASDGAGP